MGNCWRIILRAKEPFQGLRILHSIRWNICTALWHWAMSRLTTVSVLRQTRNLSRSTSVLPLVTTSPLVDKAKGLVHRHMPIATSSQLLWQNVRRARWPKLHGKILNFLCTLIQPPQGNTSTFRKEYLPPFLNQVTVGQLKYRGAPPQGYPQGLSSSHPGTVSWRLLLEPADWENPLGCTQARR